jgi:hypothetical protein
MGVNFSLVKAYASNIEVYGVLLVNIFGYIFGYEN